MLTNATIVFLLRSLLSAGNHGFNYNVESPEIGACKIIHTGVYLSFLIFAPKHRLCSFDKGGRVGFRTPNAPKNESGLSQL